MDESNDSKEMTTDASEQTNDKDEPQVKKETKKESDTFTNNTDTTVESATDPKATEQTTSEGKTNAPAKETESKPSTKTTPEGDSNLVTAVTASNLNTKIETQEETVVDEAPKSDGFLKLDEATETRMKELAEEELRAQEEEQQQFDVGIFAVKTSIGHEKMVANWLAMRARKRKLDIYAILSPPKLRGYLLLEGIKNKEALQDLIKGVQHARSVVDGATTLEEIEHFLTPKPLVSGIEEGDVVEIIAGPFKGEKAKVTQIDEAKEEITVELFEAMVSIPVTIRGDHVRILQKEGK